MAEKNCFDMTRLIFKSCVSLWCSGQVVACTCKTDSFSRRRRFLFLCIVFFFLFGLFILTVDPAGLALGSIYILRLSPEFYFGKWISKALDLHTWPSLRPEKNHKLSLLWNSSIFSTLVDIMTNNTQYTTNCTVLYCTPNIHQWPTGES